MKIKIINATTGEELERNMNSQELEEHNARVQKIAEEAEAEATKAATKAALLTKLGISEDEAKLLLS
jgi:hypothetical protein